MTDRAHKLSLTRQAELLGISRGSLYYDPRPVPEAELALDRGLAWLAANQGPEGNWESQDLGLVSMGALACRAAGHAPGRGRYGDVVQRAIDYVVNNAKPSGLLNISHSQRDMYNHGLAVFVLTQAYGMTKDRRVGEAQELPGRV